MSYGYRTLDVAASLELNVGGTLLSPYFLTAEDTRKVTR